jgi:hypothetical protein
LTRFAPELSSAALAAVLAEAAAAAVPAGLACLTSKALLVTKRAGAISASVLGLAEGVMKTMLLSKLKLAGVLLLIAAAMIGIGVGGAGYHAAAGEQDKPAQAQGERGAAAKSTPAETAALEAQLKAELNAAEANLALAAADAKRAKARFNDFQKQKEEDAAVRQNGQALAALARRFRYRVPVEIGVSEFKEGGRLEIIEVWGTRPKIEVGGQYLVRGKYALPQTGTLYFYETATGNWNNSGATLDLQVLHLPKGQGEFTVVHGMAGPGWFHLVLSEVDRYSHAYANVYFGTGENVLREKPW